MLQLVLNKYFEWKDSSKTLFYRRKGVNIGENCSFIGKNINFGSEPYLIEIGNNVRVSFDVVFITHDGATHVLRLKNPGVVTYGRIIVKDNVFIGARSIIMPNVTIGRNSVIGAGSIVTKDVEKNSVYAGNPAKRICSIEEYEKKNKHKFMNIAFYGKEEKKNILLKKSKKEF